MGRGGGGGRRPPAETAYAFCFGGFFGMRIGAPDRAHAVFGTGGNDDVERSVRACLFFGGIVLLNNIITTKQMFQKGGCQTVCKGKRAGCSSLRATAGT